MVATRKLAWHAHGMLALWCIPSGYCLPYLRAVTDVYTEIGDCKIDGDRDDMTVANVRELRHGTRRSPGDTPRRGVNSSSQALGLGTWVVELT